MGWNYPDDWNCYWTTCDECGHRYHASEGGCEACDEARFQSVETSKTVTARKSRFPGTSREIRVGDRVRVTSGFDYEVGGPRLGYFRKYRRVSKGPAWLKDVEQEPVSTTTRPLEDFLDATP